VSDPREDWRKHFHEDGRIKDPREWVVLLGFGGLIFVFVVTVTAALLIAFAR